MLCLFLRARRNWSLGSVLATPSRSRCHGRRHVQPFAPPVYDPIVVSGATQRSKRLLEVARLSLKEAARAGRDVCVSEYLVDPHRRLFTDAWSIVENIPGWLTKPNAASLFETVINQRPSTVVEIGSYLGRSTVLLSLAAKKAGRPATVFAVDPHTGDRQQLERLGAEALPSFLLFQENCRAAGVEDIVRPLLSTSTAAGKDWTEDIDVLYVDGWHSYEAVIEDGRTWLPHLAPNGVAVFDDFVAYPEVSCAVYDLVSPNRLHLWGNVFGQAMLGRSPTPPPGVRRAVRAARVLQPLYRQPKETR